jgi:hypothetical protein
MTPQSKREEALTLSEIRYWSLWRGVSCIVTLEDNGWVNTACGSFRSGGSFFAKTRPRICRRCRAELPNLRRVTDELAERERGRG